MEQQERRVRRTKYEMKCGDKRREEENRVSIIQTIEAQEGGKGFLKRAADTNVCGPEQTS
jgi:hypothetical protein